MFVYKLNCHPERSWARSLRPTQSKDLLLRLWTYATNFRFTTLGTRVSANRHIASLALLWAARNRPFSTANVDIQINKTEARIKEAQGEAAFIQQTGAAKGAEVRAVGLANAEAYQKQVEALGKAPTALVNAIKALSAGNTAFMPRILVVGGGSNQGVLESLGTMLMDKLDTSAPAPDSASPATDAPVPAAAGPAA